MPIAASNLPSPTGAQLPQGVSIVDVITFTAQLASQPQQIDPMLEDIRVITSTRSLEQFTPEDIQTLEKVYGRLETYLVTQEPLRKFTVQSLRREVFDYIENQKPNTSLALPLSITWGLTALAAAVTIIIPLPPGVAEERIGVTLTAVFAIIYAGSAWFFWGARHNFKEELRRVYLPLGLGAALLGLSLMQIPFVIVLGWSQSLWFQYATSIAPLLVGSILIYMGIRRFCKLVTLSSPFLSTTVASVVAVVAALASVIIPHIETGVPEWLFDLSLALLTIGFFANIFASILTWKLRHALAPYYKKSIRWLLAMLIGLAGTLLQFTLLQVLSTGDSSASGLLLLISSILALKASTAFYRIGNR